MILNYVSLVLFILICLFVSIWSSNAEAKIKEIKRRDKGLQQAIEDGYTISKRWDCNALTFFIDEKKKVFGFLVMAWRKDTIHYISIRDINKVEIETTGIVKKSKRKSLITQVSLNIETKQGNYLLKTLLIKRGIGVKKNSPHVLLATKAANEICDSIEKLKK